MSALPPSPFLFSSETSPGVKSPAAELLAPSPAAAGATLSRACASKAPGPSLATGMSSDPANVGGEHEEVAQDPLEKLEGTGGNVETTSLTAVGAKSFDERKHSGTAPGASGPEREVFGAPNSVNTAGTDASASGHRYREGRLQPELPSPRVCRESGGVAPTAHVTQANGVKRAEVQGSATFVEEGGKPSASILQLDGSIDLAGLDRSTTGTGSRSTPGEKDCASNFDAEMSALEAEVSALEAQWASDGILMNAATFCVSVSKDNNSKSSVTGA